MSTVSAVAVEHRRLLQSYEVGDYMDNHQQYKAGDIVTIEPNVRGGSRVAGFWCMCNEGAEQLRAISEPVINAEVRRTP